MNVNAGPGDGDRVLAIFAHPDDETLLAGGLLARWAAEGRRIDLLCVAPGPDKERRERMNAAAAVLGVASVTLLRFTDSASGESGDPSALVSLSTAPARDLVNRISGRLAETRPDVVLTHSAYGDYGHPGHALVHRATRDAVSGAAFPVRLLALDWPKWQARIALRLSGADPALKEALSTAPPTALRVNVKSYLGTRKAAASHYAPELRKGPAPLRLLEWLPPWAQSFFLGTARVSRIL